MKNEKLIEALKAKGLTVWKEKRIYINNLAEIFDLEKYTPNPKSFRKFSAYYDIEKDAFYHDSHGSRKETLQQALNDFRESVK
jgi:hypothetical protein